MSSTDRAEQGPPPMAGYSIGRHPYFEDDEELCARNVGRARRRPGEFVDAVDIPGFEDSSRWGLDGHAGGFWAQLWANDEDPDDPPRLWVGVTGPALPSPECIVALLATATGWDPRTTVDGLGLNPQRRHAVPSPETEALERLATAGADERPALEWLAGKATTCPASGLAWSHGVPSIEVVHAETLYARGMLDLGRGTPALAATRDALEPIAFSGGPGGFSRL